MKVCFLVGSLAISGGAYVIFQHASYMRRNGFDVTLAVQYPIAKGMLDWHDEAKNFPIMTFAQAKTQMFDLVIATWWQTALEIHEFKAERYAYFVQLIESCVYAPNNHAWRNYAESTYKLPVHFVTEATWIKQYLKDSYGQDAALVKNGIRKDIYNLNGKSHSPRLTDSPRILIEGPFAVDRKNTAYAVRLAQKAKAKSIWIMTSSNVQYFPNVDKVFSRISIANTAEIYRSCDIILKLSTSEGMFGPPLEMFHCGGTAIVFNVAGHDEYIIDNYNARVAHIGDSDHVVSILDELLHNQNELNRLKENALKTANNWASWEQSSKKFMEWSIACMSSSKQSHLDIQSKNSQAKLTFDSELIIDLKNKSIFEILKQFQGKFMHISKPYLPLSIINLIKRFKLYIDIFFGGNYCK